MRYRWVSICGVVAIGCELAKGGPVWCGDKLSATSGEWSIEARRLRGEGRVGLRGPVRGNTTYDRPGTPVGVAVLSDGVGLVVTELIGPHGPARYTASLLTPPNEPQIVYSVERRDDPRATDVEGGPIFAAVVGIEATRSFVIVLRSPDYEIFKVTYSVVCIDGASGRITGQRKFIRPMGGRLLQVESVPESPLLLWHWDLIIPDVEARWALLQLTDRCSDVQWSYEFESGYERYVMLGTIRCDPLRHLRLQPKGFVYRGPGENPVAFRVTQTGPGEFEVSDFDDENDGDSSGQPES